MRNKRPLVYAVAFAAALLAAFALGRVTRTVPAAAPNQGPGPLAASLLAQSRQEPYASQPAVFTSGFEFGGPQAVAPGGTYTLNWRVPGAAFVRIRDVSDGGQGFDAVKALSPPYAALGIAAEPARMSFPLVRLKGDGYEVEQAAVEMPGRRYELIAYRESGEEFMRLYTTVRFEQP